MTIDSGMRTDAAKIVPQPAVTVARKSQAASKETIPAQTQAPATDTVTINSAAKDSTQAQTTDSDTVTISMAAKAAQEALETHVQTAKEAWNGDLQARRKLAKQAAAEESTEPAFVKSQEAAGISE